MSDPQSPSGSPTALAPWEQGFHAFLTEAKIEDANTHATVPFIPWAAQEKTIELLAQGRWLLILKARQLGFTWLFAAYAVWMTLQPRRRVLVFFQDKEYAADFLDRCRFIQENLPETWRLPRTRDNQSRLEFNAEQHGSYIRALAATKRAAHSVSANLLIVDEAAHIALLSKILNAARPTLETEGGQAVVLSTSNGPAGHFWRMWNNAWTEIKARGEHKGGTSAAQAPPAVWRSFLPLFFAWNARPGRSAEWRRHEGEANAGDPVYLKRQYPAIAEEAFEQAEGRVYPLFSAYGDAGKTFVRTIDVSTPHAREWKHYRAIDFGGVDPFVCLWVCVVPGDPPGLTIDPSCRNTIREMLAYSYGENDCPKDEDNHAPDALRYLIVTAGGKGLRGHVHVYREMYEPDSAGKGLSLPMLAQRINEFSGGQHFETTVADRSRPDSITLLCQMGIQSVPALSLGGGTGSDVKQGIIRVNALITATGRTGEAPAGLPEIKPVKAPRMDFSVERMRRPWFFG
ncbi:MAG: terminase family protein [Planctomycetota bacterium]